MYAKVKTTITWGLALGQTQEQYEIIHGFRSVSRKGILNKALRVAKRLPCYADRASAGLGVYAKVEIVETGLPNVYLTPFQGK